MANCATELRDTAATRVQDNCPDDTELVMFVGTTGYFFRTWQKLISCIATAVAALIGTVPDDWELVITGTLIGKTYYQNDDLKNKRYRLYRDGLLLNASQYSKDDSTGTWTLIDGAVLEEDVTYTHSFY